MLTVLGLDESPVLRIAVKQARDTRDQERRFPQLDVSEVRLSYWPGEHVARAWIAASFAGYLMHEALELVTVGGEAVLDPHKEPYEYDRGLRTGTPTVLTPQSLHESLCVVMLPATADDVIARGN
jgi:hypothetical protein